MLAALLMKLLIKKSTPSLLPFCAAAPVSVISEGHASFRFPSVVVWGVLVYRCVGELLLFLLSLLNHDRLHGLAGSFWPRTEPYRQTKLYAKCLSLTIVVMTEIKRSVSSGRSRESSLHQLTLS